MATPAILDCILDVISVTRRTLEMQKDCVALDLNVLLDDHCKLTDLVNTSESTLTSIQAFIDNLKTHVATLTDKLSLLKNRAEDAEGRRCYDNMGVVGLPEVAETNDMVLILGTLDARYGVPTSPIPILSAQLAHRLPERLLP
ncbi:hypothetical protein NDU88_001634 [Pleurodeles waltl]|uniref:Uncharacterized protein n=1 Tax=Pleurodeles waltl TaxID=8319 RepID=A0AAV7KTE1_PLEWA|nr:hypothetical protein NDU88_001634 [Pleurodeles waltl]